MTEKGIFVFALLLTLELNLGNFCPPAGPRGAGDIYCLVFNQAPDGPEPAHSPYQPTQARDVYSAGATGATGGTTQPSPSASA